MPDTAAGPDRLLTEGTPRAGQASPLQKRAQMAVELQPGSAWEVAQARFDAAADVIGLKDDVRKILREPKRELTVHFPVRLDDSSVRLFTGYRVQHNISRGPAKGGLRYAPDVNL